jgi:hypothetical protein
MIRQGEQRRSPHWIWLWHGLQDQLGQFSADVFNRLARRHANESG